jgi:DNA repair exonuclease SbcCD ATPase subunit
MSAPEPPDEQSAQPSSPERGARAWIVATIVLAVVAVGLGAWALSLRSDVDDKDAEIAAQQQQLEQQKGVANDIPKAAGGIAQDVQQAMRDLAHQLEEIQGTTTATQEQMQQAIDRAENAAADAQARVKDARSELDRARAQADEAGAKAEAAAACARGYISAIARAFDAPSLSDGVAQAKSEFQALAGSCSGTLGS